MKYKIIAHSSRPSRTKRFKRNKSKTPVSTEILPAGTKPLNRVPLTTHGTTDDDIFKLAQEIGLGQKEEDMSQVKKKSSGKAERAASL